MLTPALIVQFVTGWTQSIYYAITVRVGDPKPQPGSPRHVEHRRRIHILVVSLYLLYTIYEADHDLRRIGSFYTDLGVATSATDRDIKSRFRRLAAVYHPDKAGSDAPDAAAYFMHLKTASDTLTEPAKRFAYDRFGAEVVGWQHCSSVRDFVARGVFQGVLPHYGVAAAAMYVFGLLGYMDWGKYYRWLLLVVLCVFELHVVTRPNMPHFVERFINPALTTLTTHPPFLQFQLISLLRKVCITLYIAFSQIGPLLNPQRQAAKKAAEGGEAAVREGLQRLEGAAAALDTEAARLLDMEMAPLVGDPEAVASLRGKVKEWLVQNTIRADPMVRDALGNSLKKRRIDAPSGAKGNR
jgi:hypothetical protein